MGVCFQYVEALIFNKRPNSAEENKPLQHQFSCQAKSQSVLAGWPGCTTYLCFHPPAARCSDAAPPPMSSSAWPEPVSHPHTGQGGHCCSKPDWLIWGQTRESTSHFLRERFDLRNIRQQLVPVKHFDWTRSIPWAQLSSMTSPSFPITNNSRCSC